MIDAIFAYGVEYFEELLFNASPTQPLHLLLWSPGGDGEVAVRLVRSAQARCSELTVIVPDIAKSAATLFALGADKILMGPASDLGPVDPQFQVGEYDLVSAKDIIAAVKLALDDVAERPDTYPLHSALLADVNALRVQQARSALDRTDDLVKEALLSNPRRTEPDVEQLAKRLHEPLIEAPKDHAAIFSAEDARKLRPWSMSPAAWR
jgi:ClpP class serine protease